MASKALPIILLGGGGLLLAVGLSKSAKAGTGEKLPITGGPQPTLRKGSSGAAVRTLQARLNTLGFNVGAVDGIFGAKTDAAVRAFQRSRGLVADGIVGPKTWAALGASGAAPAARTAPAAAPRPGARTAPAASSAIVRKGSRGPNVQTLQTLLNAKGFPVGKVDGVFGAKTDVAVRNFQKSKGLTADGVVGSKTWAALGARVKGWGSGMAGEGDDVEMEDAAPPPPTEATGRQLVGSKPTANPGQNVVEFACFHDALSPAQPFSRAPGQGEPAAILRFGKNAATGVISVEPRILVNVDPRKYQDVVGLSRTFPAGEEREAVTHALRTVGELASAMAPLGPELGDVWIEKYIQPEAAAA